MDKNANAFGKLAAAFGKTPESGEGWLDHVNFALTPALLLAIASLLGTKQYVFNPIQCWSIKEVDGRQRMQYAENYCWIENTFPFDSDKPVPHVDKPGADAKIYYYQWVPFILMAQAVVFYVPHLIWLMLSTNVGIDMRQLALQARKIESDSSDDRQKKIVFLCESLLRFIRYRSRYRDKSCLKRFLSFVVGKPAFSMYFVFTYVLVKACYVANCIGQLYLMRSFLGLNITSFGLQILSDISNNRTWQSSNVFPRVTFCHFEVRGVGRPSPYVLQCVLPVNMLNEKFYIAIWFWVVTLLTLNIASAGRCLLKLMIGSSRRREVKKYLKIAECVDTAAAPGDRFRRASRLEDAFVADFMRSDGSFMLSVVNKNAGDIVTAEVVKATFLKWRQERSSAGDFLTDGHSNGKYASDEHLEFASHNKPVVV